MTFVFNNMPNVVKNTSFITQNGDQTGILGRYTLFSVDFIQQHNAEPFPTYIIWFKSLGIIFPNTIYFHTYITEISEFTWFEFWGANVMVSYTQLFLTNFIISNPKN